MSSLLSAKRLSENLAQAEENYQKGKKKAGTTLLRWKPDWEQAARFYRESVKFYKLAGDSSSVTDALLQALKDAAHAHREIQSFHTAAADLEFAAGLLKEKKQDLEGAADLYKQSSDLYRLHGSSVDKCASTLMRACECLGEVGQVEGGVELAKQACALFEEEGKGVFHDATFKRAISFCVAQGKLGSARSLLRRQIAIARQHLNPFEADLYKNILSIVVLRFHSGEPELAREELHKLESVERFSRSEECVAANELVAAWEDGNEEAWSAALKGKSCFKFLLNPIAVIARKLKMPAGGDGGSGGTIEAEEAETEQAPEEAASSSAQKVAKKKKKPVVDRKSVV